LLPAVVAILIATVTGQQPLPLAVPNLQPAPNISFAKPQESRIIPFEVH